MYKIKENIKYIYFDAGNVLFYKVTTEGENIAKELGFPPEQYQDIIDILVKQQGEKLTKQFYNLSTLEEQKDDLLKYCELDTLAMVRVWEELRKRL